MLQDRAGQFYRKLVQNFRREKDCLKFRWWVKLLHQKLIESVLIEPMEIVFSNIPCVSLLLLASCLVRLERWNHARGRREEVTCIVSRRGQLGVSQHLPPFSFSASQPGSNPSLQRAWLQDRGELPEPPAPLNLI